MEEDLKEELRARIALQMEELDKAMPGSEEAERITRSITSMTEALNKLNQTDVDAYDKEERRETDKKKNQQQHDLERDKMKLSWDRVLFEGGKIVVPTAISWAMYTINQSRLLKFEETGRVVSDAGRNGIRLPSIFSFIKK